MGMLAALRSPAARKIRHWALEAFILAVVIILEAGHVLRDGDVPGIERAAEAVAICLIAAPLVVRRSRPVPVFAVIMVLSAGFSAWDGYPLGNAAPVVALYTLASLRPRKEALAAALVIEVGAVLQAALPSQRDDGGFLLNLAVLTGIIVAAVALGLYVNTRRAYIGELVDRTDRLERERAQSDELAAATERARIAREMHDIVAHNITVMVALSDAAARLVRRDPEQAIETLATVSATGRDALQDTRSLLGVLGNRSPVSEATESRRPIPRLSDLEALVDNVREAGLPVEIHLQGPPAALPADAQLAVYRLVQEALTNTMKHAPSHARAQVDLTYTGSRLLLVVEDDGGGKVVAPTSHAGGGTTGMRARVRSLGGRIESGPRTAGGWRVSAELPLSGPPAGPSSPGEGQ